MTRLFDVARGISFSLSIWCSNLVGQNIIYVRINAADRQKKQSRQRIHVAQACIFLSTIFRYKVVYLGLVKSKDWTRGGIYVDINNIVEKKITGWQVDAKTLTTRVGGVIGVGKNLFWVAILLITSSVSFLGLVSKYFKKKFIK